MTTRIGDYFSRLLSPADDFRLSATIFLKSLALIYFAAFASLVNQIDGLVGPSGILPFGELSANIQAVEGSKVYLQYPTLFWWNSSQWALEGAALLGCIFAFTLLIGVRPRLSLLAMFVLYLSLHYAGQLFLNFQWDYLLLESGFLALFLLKGPSRLTVFLFHWLLFRLRFLSGISKLASEDPSWSGLTALKYYFETQPLPHVGAWYAHQLPEWLLKTGAGITLFAELVVPLFIFLPRPFRIAAALITIGIQLLIIATSNHNWINLLTIALCLFLIDDRALRSLVPRRWRSVDTRTVHGADRPRLMPLLAAALILSASLPPAISMSTGWRPPQALMNASAAIRRFGVGNAYHIFPTMQTERQELEIQGSRDGVNWQSYRFRYKPGPAARAPPFIVPYQPRLDWMIWFVPTHSPENLYWFDRFMRRLWRGQIAVTGLLAHDPFAGDTPRYLRALVYRYRFTDFTERERTGLWWHRELLGEFPQTPPRRP